MHVFVPVRVDDEKGPMVYKVDPAGGNFGYKVRTVFRRITIGMACFRHVIIGPTV